MKLIPFIFSVSPLILSATALASIDIRHEYKTERDYHSSRAKFGYKYEDNWKFGLELKFRSKDQTDFMGNVEVNAKEFTLEYNHRINREWKFSPSMPIETSYGNETYKPQLRLTYTPLSNKNWAMSGRYRLDIKPHEEIKKHRHRLTFVNSYKTESFRYVYEGNFYHSDNSNYHLYDGRRNNYEHNLKITYRGADDWMPYIEFGDISRGSSSHHRELRTRIGVRYAFDIFERDELEY